MTTNDLDALSARLAEAINERMPADSVSDSYALPLLSHLEREQVSLEAAVAVLKAMMSRYLP